MDAANDKNTAKQDIKYIEINPGQLETSKTLAGRISAVLDGKMARDIKILEVNRQTIIADYFVVATGTSPTHVRALAGEVEFQMREKFEISPSRISGQGNEDWIILDYDS
ncbi:MAG: ribosome silencing factor, partial [Oscillospiraceae bacterium]|nr:ribosome silencing factor [Oscillospiraceae bacterium]